MRFAAVLQYVALTAPVFVPAVADAPQPMDRWKPTYADRVPAKPRTVVYPQATVPPFQAPVVVASGGQIIALGTVKTWQYPSLTGPFQETQAAPTVLNTFVTPPDRVWSRRGTHPSRQQSFAIDAAYTAPAAAAVPDLQPPTLAQPRRVAFPRAVYTWAQPHFGFTVAAPVMSWTGRYPDFPVRRGVRFQPEPRPFPLAYDQVINPPAVALSWGPRYPDRVPPRARRQASLEPVAIAPIYIPEVTVPSVGTGWLPRLVDALQRKGYPTSQQQAFFFDRFAAPTPVVVPNLAQPVYPDRVYGRRPNTVSVEYLGPLQVPDVTQPVTALSWLAQYPHWLEHRSLPTHAQLSYTGVVFLVEFIPAPDIHEISGSGSFDRKIHGRSSYNTTLRGRGSL